MPTTDDAELVDALESMMDALSDEVEAIESRGRTRTIRYSSAELVRTASGVHIYEFALRSPTAPVEAVTVAVDAAGTIQTGELLDAGERSMTIGVRRSLGASPKRGVIEVEPSALLVATQHRLADIVDDTIELDAASMMRLLGVECEYDGECSPIDEAEIESPGLDEYQRGAIERAIDSDLLFVWGPPGTGKTRTLGALARVLVDRGERVLVTAHAHVAVDTAVIAAVEAGCDNVRRLGAAQLAEVPEHVQVERLPDEPSAGVEAMTLTKLVVSNIAEERSYDRVLIDEASMALLPHAVIAAGLGAKTVVFGDVRQLPPVVVARTPDSKRWLGRDVFETSGVVSALDSGAVDRRIAVLRRQYRSHPDIAAVTNAFAYDGQLESCEVDYDDDAIVGAGPGPGSRVVLWDTAAMRPISVRPAASRCNPITAALCAYAATSIVTSAGAFASGDRVVGIATPYVEQMRLIRDALDDLGWGESVEVATVHRFQGGERQAIIVDLCDSRPLRPPPMLAGDAGLRLVNVAMSRAISKLVVIADSTWLRGGPLGRAIELVATHGSQIDASTSDAIEWLSIDEFMADAPDDIGAARERVLVRAPRLRRNQIADAVVEAATHGADVTIVTDETADRDCLSILSGAGVDIQVAKRVHERIVVADNIAFVGNTTSHAASAGRAMARLALPSYSARLAGSLTPRCEPTTQEKPRSSR